MFKKTESVYCCRKCGTVQALLKKSHDQKVNCPFCNSIMKNVPSSVDMYKTGTDKKYKTWQDVVRKEWAKPRYRDAELYEKREIYEASLIKETPDKHSKVEQKKQQEEIQKLKNNSNTINKEKYIPKCPICGSPNIKPIGAGERTLSVLTLGLLSNKINKSFKCNDCGGTF